MSGREFTRPAVSRQYTMIRIPFDSLTLMAVTDELDKLLVGGQIQRVTQPVESDLLLTVRNRGGNHHLILSCDSAFARAHLTSSKRPNPKSPPDFCMICRKYLENGIITAVDQRGFDRILDIRIRSGDAHFLLVAELMGKHSNLILVAEDGAILDSAKRITHKASRFREVLPGIAYVPPPQPEGKEDPFKVSTDSLNGPRTAVEIQTRFAGFSPFLAAEIAARAADTFQKAWEEIFVAASAGNWSPVSILSEQGDPAGAYPFASVQIPSELQQREESLSASLDRYYGFAIPRAALDSAIHSLESAVAKAIKAKESRRESIRRSLAESGRAEEYKKCGEILLANLRLIEPQAESVMVTDYYGEEPEERAILLDPRKSPQENAESYFRRYRKSRDGAKIHREQLVHMDSVLKSLVSARESISGISMIEDANRIRRELLSEGVIAHEQEEPRDDKKPRGSRDFGGKRIRVFNTPEGWDIYLGENSEANDHLTLRVASPSDIWLHVRGSTSAHVVIRTGNNPAGVPQAVLQRAAILAAQHSGAKHSSMVPVDYTLKRYVRRPRGTPSGSVTYQNEKTLHVSPGRD